LRSSRTDRGTSDRLRLDLFLKRSRLIKRRTLAATICDNGYVKVNGREAPPGKTVRVGDQVEIRYPRERVTIEVTRLPVRAQKAQECYLTLSVDRQEEDLY
jgi:ribosomal 50S subunit-recycling heat shock protein